MSEVVGADLGPSTSGVSDPRVVGVASTRPGRRAPRRRPSGAAPPLPRALRTTGVGWLVGAVVALVVTALIYRNGVRGVAITAIVVDNTVVRWMSDIDVPGINGVARGVSYAASWWVIEVTVWLLTVALIVFRRWRLLVIYLVVSQVAVFVHDRLYDLTTQPRPFGVALRGSWGGWSLPSIHMLSLAGLLVIALYTLVPEGQPRNRLKWVVAGVVTLVSLARLHLGADSLIGILIGVIIGVSCAVTSFRFFAPSEVFPVTYRRGRTAHLDVEGPRGEAIRRAVADQLGLTVSEIRPVGLSGSAGSTPLRLRVDGASSPYLFGKLYSLTHLRSDRWYKLGRELLYGRLEDEKPFHTVRRLVQQEDYALRVFRDAGVPGPKSYGFVELTPEREYMLVTEFLDDAVELGVAEVDERAHRRGPRSHPHPVGRRPCPPRHQTGQPDGARWPHPCHRRRVRRAPTDAVASSGRSGQHDAVPVPSLERATGLRSGAPAIHDRGGVGSIRGGTRSGPAVAATPGSARWTHVTSTASSSICFPSDPNRSRCSAGRHGVSWPVLPRPSSLSSSPATGPGCSTTTPTSVPR